MPFLFVSIVFNLELDIISLTVFYISMSEKKKIVLCVNDVCMFFFVYLYHILCLTKLNKLNYHLHAYS